MMARQRHRRLVIDLREHDGILARHGASTEQSLPPSFALSTNPSNTVILLTPHIILLQGPGPFQLPRLGSDVNYLALESGAIEIRLETGLGQGVRIILPELVAATLRSLLVAEFGGE
jgi:hypothetical protein